MEALAFLAVGMALGWQWCAWWKDKPASEEEMIGKGLVAAATDIYRTARFVGSGPVIERRWSSQSKIGEIVIVIRREASEMVDL